MYTTASRDCPLHQQHDATASHATLPSNAVSNASVSHGVIRNCLTHDDVMGMTSGGSAPLLNQDVNSNWRGAISKGQSAPSLRQNDHGVTSAAKVTSASPLCSYESVNGSIESGRASTKKKHPKVTVSVDFTIFLF